MIEKKNIFQIAIDGPSGAGKSTIAKGVAKLLQIQYIDTGAMYRAIGYKILKSNIDIKKEIEITTLLDDTTIDIKDNKIYLDGIDVDDKIRTSQISKMAALVSKDIQVRKNLVDIQRKLGESKSIVMDGRDIGTNVLPNAKYKFYMTASSKMRAERRWKELVEKGENISFDEVLKDIENRDFEDMNRKLNPLKKAQDAKEIDTTLLNIDEVVKIILEEVKKNGDC